MTTDFFPNGMEMIGEGFLEETPRLISLDFDGTLSEIAPTPSAAKISDGFRILLSGLTSLPETRVVVLSGRSLPDLKNKLGVPGAVLVGNHGLDFSSVSMGWGVSALSRWTRQTSEIKERLTPVVKKWPGAFLELKGPDLSLHYRALLPGRVEQLIPEALEAVEGLPVVSSRGKCVLEFKPEGAPGKGEALQHIAAKYFKDPSAGLCVHIGDDTTDEAAFMALRYMRRLAFGLKVGPGETRAHFRLKGLEEVHRFLALILDHGKRQGGWG